MPKTITVELSKKSIQAAIEELKDYKSWIRQQMNVFVDELLNVGIKTGRRISRSTATPKDYRGAIVFSKEITTSDGEVEGLLIATDGKKIERTWKTKNGIRTVEISPSLMSEFGSGWLSVVLDNVPGVGQGTFPGQIHATDPNGWYWKDEDGTLHHSIGEAPSFPVHRAMLEMMRQVDEIGRKVFSNG